MSWGLAATRGRMSRFAGDGRPRAVSGAVARPVQRGGLDERSDTRYLQGVTTAEGSRSVAAVVASRGRQTGPRRFVAELIAEQPGHFTAADLADAAAARGRAPGRATIFRTLELLRSAGALDRIDLPDGSHAYIACEERHHHHAVCSRCGTVADFDDAELAGVVADVARRTGYRIETHRLELYGLCPACQAAEGRRP